MLSLQNSFSIITRNKAHEADHNHLFLWVRVTQDIVSACELKSRLSHACATPIIVFVQCAVIKDQKRTLQHELLPRPLQLIVQANDVRPNGGSSITCLNLFISAFSCGLSSSLSQHMLLKCVRPRESLSSFPSRQDGGMELAGSSLCHHHLASNSCR